MKRLTIAAFLLGCSALWCLASAAEHSPASAPSGTVKAAKDTQPHPSMSGDVAWTSTMVGVILAMFALAIPVGLIVGGKQPPQETAPAAENGHSHGNGHDHH